MLALVVTVVMADGNGDGGQIKVSGGSGGDSGYGGGRQEQKLQGQATINKMWQAAVVAVETGVVAESIATAQLQWQAGVAVRQK
jgi:hypothetical protein